MTKIRMPKKIKVGGLEYKIKFPYTFDTDQEMHGLHLGGSTEIKIAGYIENIQRPTSTIYTTLLHEICHAIDTLYCRDKFSEDGITQMAMGLYQVLVDNELNIVEDGAIPTKLKVGGFIYDVEFPYSFTDEVTSISSYVRNSRLKMLVSGGSGSEIYSNRFIKQNFIYCIVAAISCVYGVDRDRDSELQDSLLTFAAGLYQVLVDNKLEILIKENKS